MGLATCPDCGRQVSDAAPACPGCGRPFAAVQPQVVHIAGQQGPVVVRKEMGCASIGCLALAFVVVVVMIAGSLFK